MRAFIGIDLDKELKEEIVKLQYNLRKYSTSGRWTNEENFHLTLKFLGDINGAQQEQISEGMIKICNNIKPLNLSIERLGIFEGDSSIRVLWLGLGGDISALRLLQSNIENEISKIGFEKEKRAFKPHITIGQNLVINYPSNSIEDIVNIQKLTGICADRMFLFKSEQSGKKRIYTKIDEYLMK
jgi:RNA 2',3'-cyclic 3'-phosphodiesterase